MITENLQQDEKVIAAAVIPVLPGAAPFQIQREAETQGLVEALDCACLFVDSVTVRKPNPAYLLGQGQLEAIKERLEEADCSLFVVDAHLSPIQQRNLERFLACKVIDRTGLILEIFGLRARTRAGRLQVETARLAYERSRLVRTWTHLERQRGGGGFIAGPGETQIEADRRMLDAALLRLKKQLREVEKTRRLQRSGRRNREAPVVALVGYTNAGKSTLFNALSGADVFAKDMPFATLDPTIRQVELDHNKQIALVDTVGFITDLPTALVDSFKATLEETVDADLILHVHDASSPDVYDQAADVLNVLSDLEDMTHTDLPPILNVWNKVDRLGESERDYLLSNAEDDVSGGANVLVSAQTGEGLDTLRAQILADVYETTTRMEIKLGPAEGAAIAWLHRHGQVRDQKSDPETGDIQLSVDLSDQKYNQFAKAFGHLL